MGAVGPRPQVVAGLGNPGPGYRDTRHNVGQAVLDRLAGRLGARFRVQVGAAVAEVAGEAGPLVLAKPVAYMNQMGPGVARLLERLGLDAAALILVHDDIDLPLGTVRVRHQGRHGGHNGVRSVIETLGTARIRRVKVGVGRPASRPEVVDWVLTPFTAEERQALPEVLDRAADLVLALARDAAGPPPGPPPGAGGST